MADAGADNVGASAQPRGRGAQGAAEVGEVGAADVAQLDVLEVAPDALVEGIEVGGVAGQRLQVQARCVTAGLGRGGEEREELLDRL
jgi:hypothetical protein